MLSAIGLAPAAQVERASAKARQSGDKVRKLEERLVKLRGDVEMSRQRQQAAAADAAEWKAAAGRAEAEAARIRAQLDDCGQRIEGLTTEVTRLRERLDESRRVATVARQHLMSTEVKLDLIEAAIHVLDERTRAEV